MPVFQGQGFGWLRADDCTFTDDVIVTTAGEIIPRPKHLSKKYGGWHTVLGPEEIEAVLAGNPEVLVIGCGHFGLLPIRPETRERIRVHGTAVELARIHTAMARYDQLRREGRRVAAVLHLTC